MRVCTKSVCTVLLCSHCQHQQHHHRHQQQVQQHPNRRYQLDQRAQLNIAARKKCQVTNKLAAGNFFDEHKVLGSYFKSARTHKEHRLTDFKRSNTTRVLRNIIFYS